MLCHTHYLCYNIVFLFYTFIIQRWFGYVFLCPIFRTINVLSYKFLMTLVECVIMAMKIMMMIRRKRWVTRTTTKITIIIITIVISRERSGKIARIHRLMTCSSSFLHYQIIRVLYTSITALAHDLSSLSTTHLSSLL